MLKKGKPLDDPILIEILVEAIRLGLYSLFNHKMPIFYNSLTWDITINLSGVLGWSVGFKSVLRSCLPSFYRRIPEGTGWIMDGFPTSYNQAKALEKALSGFDVSTKEAERVRDVGNNGIRDIFPVFDGMNYVDGDFLSALL